MTLPFYYVLHGDDDAAVLATAVSDQCHACTAVTSSDD